MLSGSFGGFAKLEIFSEANAIRCGEYAIETDLLRVSDSLEIVRRERRLTAGKENDDLSSRFERDCAIENRFRIFKRRLVYVTNLIRIHEARVAHHVAAIGQVDSQNCAASKLDIRSAVTMHVFVFGSAEVATKEERLDAPQKLRVSRHHVFKLPMLRTIFAHHDLAIVFYDLSLDLAGMLVHQRFERSCARDHGVANFFNAGWTKTVGLTREAEWRSSAFIGFEQGTRRPVRANRFAFGQSPVNGLKSFPGHIGETGNEAGAFYSRQLTFFGFPPAKLITKQRLFVSLSLKRPKQPSIINMICRIHKTRLS